MVFHDRGSPVDIEQGQMIDLKCEKLKKIDHFEFFSAIFELIREPVSVHKKVLKLSHPQDEIIDEKCEKLK